MLGIREETIYIATTFVIFIGKYYRGKGKILHFLSIWKWIRKSLGKSSAFLIDSIRHWHISIFKYRYRTRESKLSSFHLEFSLNSIRYICLLFYCLVTFGFFWHKFCLKKIHWFDNYLLQVKSTNEKNFWYRITLRDFARFEKLKSWQDAWIRETYVTFGEMISDLLLWWWKPLEI